MSPDWKTVFLVESHPSSALRLPFSRNVSGNLGGRQAVGRMRCLSNFQPPQEEILLRGNPLPSALQVKTGCRGWRASPFCLPVADDTLNTFCCGPQLNTGASSLGDCREEGLAAKAPALYQLSLLGVSNRGGYRNW